MNDWGRRVFVAALTICFGTLVVLFARNTVASEMVDYKYYPRINESVTLTVGDDGILYFDGIGKLYSEDVEALIHQRSMDDEAIQDIIVGNGITEIGYKAFKSMDHLRTLKLGENVTRVAVNGVVRCGALQFVLLPQELESVGRDFLFMCDECRVVTQVTPDKIVRMDNVSEDRVLGGVYSFEALIEACPVDDELAEVLRHWWP